MFKLELVVHDGKAYIQKFSDSNDLKYSDYLTLEQLHDLFEDLEEAVWEVRDAIRELEKE